MARWPKLKPPLERNVQAACMEWLNTIPGVRVWRQNSGAITAQYGDRKRFVRFGEPGQADLTGIFAPSGIRIETRVYKPQEANNDKPEF